MPRARQLRTAWTQAFGYLPAGGFASGGVTTGHVDGSAHYEGRAIDVFFRPLGDREQHRRGWVFAQWVLAHAADHQVLSIIYDDHIWTSWAAGFGWRDYVHPGATMRAPRQRRAPPPRPRARGGRERAPVRRSAERRTGS